MTADLSQRAAVPRRVSAVTAGPCGAPEQEKESRPRKRAVECYSGLQRLGGLAGIKEWESLGRL